MLCSHGIRSVPRPFLDIYCPVRGLRSEVTPVLVGDYALQRNLRRLNSSLELMDTLRREILGGEEEPARVGDAAQPGAVQLKEGECFGLTVDAAGFSPEELCVRQAGRKLRVSGRKERKQEDGTGSYSYTLQEFRREFDLPEGLRPEDVACHLAPDGKLHIQAARAPSAEEPERELPIQTTPQCARPPTGSDNNAQAEREPPRQDEAVCS